MPAKLDIRRGDPDTRIGPDRNDFGYRSKLYIQARIAIYAKIRRGYDRPSINRTSRLAQQMHARLRLND